MSEPQIDDSACRRLPLSDDGRTMPIAPLSHIVLGGGRHLVRGSAREPGWLIADLESSSEPTWAPTSTAVELGASEGFQIVWPEPVDGDRLSAAQAASLLSEAAGGFDGIQGLDADDPASIARSCDDLFRRLFDMEATLAQKIVDADDADAIATRERLDWPRRSEQILAAFAAVADPQEPGTVLRFFATKEQLLGPVAFAMSADDQIFASDGTRIVSTLACLAELASIAWNRELDEDSVAIIRDAARFGSLKLKRLHIEASSAERIAEIDRRIEMLDAVAESGEAPDDPLDRDILAEAVLRFGGDGGAHLASPLLPSLLAQRFARMMP